MRGPLHSAAHPAALIWDLDGTLIDSYRCIVPSLRQFYAEQGLPRTEAEILRAVLGSSVRDYAQAVYEQTGISLEAGMERYQQLRAESERELQPIPHAPEVLKTLRSRGVRHFLFTHRGASTAQALVRTGLAGLFDELVTAQSGFPRKPAPDAILALIRRHGLNPKRTWYVGDRALDMECAKNAGVGGILYHPAGSAAPMVEADYVLQALPELLELFV